MIRLGLPTGALDVLCLGAHPDDVEIGCGGTLLRLADRPGTTVRGVVMTGATERVAEATAALDAFAPGATLQSFDLPDGRLPAHWGEVKEALEQVAGTCRPHLLLAPRTDDAHQDHRLVGSLVRTVWRDALVLHYEIPKWDGDTGAPSHFVPLTEEQARHKVKLLNTHYRTQVGRDWWDDELFLGLMRVRGMEARAPYAEGFFTGKVLLELGGEAP
ncbi:PIG-L deacetylase family protein [Nocardioides sediminis]|uniref:PIG-L deacetylase family protein n=1 Tax=Nocardioides sediminis TaxID=433648 RepID=UPI000D310238|nr:PIG-L deacetylase family protein [Nocardioides sediminis]